MSVGRGKGAPERVPGPLRRNNKLVRHAAIRRILLGRYHSNGISTLDALSRELVTHFGIRVSNNTLSVDLRELGAIKATDLEATPPINWWVIPAFNPSVEDIRNELDPDIVEAEVGFKLAAHVVDVAPVGRFVYVLTEARAGLLVAYWLSWLSWPEVLMVQEGIDSAVIHCLTPDAALNVAERLVGYAVPVEEVSGAGGEGEGDGDE